MAIESVKAVLGPAWSGAEPKVLVDWVAKTGLPIRDVRAAIRHLLESDEAYICDYTGRIKLKEKGRERFPGPRPQRL
jgi:hypothetical protein